MKALVLIFINFFDTKMILQFDRIFMNIERHFYVIEVFYRICGNKCILNSWPRESSASLMVVQSIPMIPVGVYFVL